MDGICGLCTSSTESELNNLGRFEASKNKILADNSNYKEYLFKGGFFMDSNSPQTDITISDSLKILIYGRPILDGSSVNVSTRLLDI